MNRSPSPTAAVVRLTALLAVLLPLAKSGHAQERVLGVDISYWNCGSSSVGISQANWNTGFNAGNRKFAFIRSSRGGTTGVDKTAGVPGGGTQQTLSQRYDDPRFLQNISRATIAGMYAGPYHFARLDIATNTGTDEADHFIQAAGPWMRPGYLVPVFDLEAGQGVRNNDGLAQFCIDFSNRIFEVMRIRPGMYINGNYSNLLQGSSPSLRDALAKPGAYTPSVVSPAFSMLWDARYGAGNISQTSPEFSLDLIPVQTGSPKNNGTVNNTYYGPWDDYGNSEPWAFWQYASVVSVPGFNAVDSTIDSNVAHGDIEFVRNFLVPAVWWHDNNGNWGDLANWNSGQPASAPVIPGAQPTPYPVDNGVNPIPVPRLPGAAGSGPTSGQYDTVILERPNADITVTLSSGTYNIRKLYMRETLNITGGSLTVNYDPTYRPDDSPYVKHGGPISAQFSGPVTISGNAMFKAHTIQVDAGKTVTLNGGLLRFNKMLLQLSNVSPAKIVVGSNVQFASDSAANAFPVITNGSGTGLTGSIDLTGGNRTFTVHNGTELTLGVPVNNGALVKSGPGILRLPRDNPYAGGTTINGGRVIVSNTGGSATGSGPVTVNSGGIFGGTGRIAGTVTVNGGATLTAGTTNSIGTLTLESTPVLNGTTALKISRVGGVTSSDQIVVSGKSITYGGVLAVTLQGDALVGGEVFTLFSASSYSGQFSLFNLPSLAPGLNWYVGDLAVNGTIRVNRSPVAAGLKTFTNDPMNGVEIPISTILSGATDPDGNPVFLASVGTSTNGVVLSTNATSVFYSSSLNAQDQFSYTIHDGKGGTATGLVRIVPSSEGVFTRPPVVGDDAVTLKFFGAPGDTYFLERSTNLVNWETISTNVMPSNGVLEFDDESSPNGSGAVFYRLHWAE